MSKPKYVITQESNGRTSLASFDIHTLEHAKEWARGYTANARDTGKDSTFHVVRLSDASVMTEGEIWKVKGLLGGDPFEVEFSSWDSLDPERKAREFYDGQTFLINTSLTCQHITRTWDAVIESKDGPETREGGAAEAASVDLK